MRGSDIGDHGSPRTVLLVHERYKQAGGEDVVFESEARLLASQGHEVVKLVMDNTSIPEQLSVSARAKLAGNTVWSFQSASRVRRAVERYRPEIVHVHNTFPLLSPSIYSACRSAGVPIVQTLHNYRLVCPVATLFRDGAPCEDCVGRRIPWPSVLHACYHASRPETAVVAAMLALHQLRKTWENEVDMYVVLTRFARQKFVEGGLPPDRIVVKPNFVSPDPGVREISGADFLFVGRLSEEKGIRTLLDAWTTPLEGARLRVVGDGPLRPLVEQRAETSAAVDYLGALDRDAVIDEMQRARAIVVPSMWYEGHPLTIIEAFAAGRPVIASRLGSMIEMVDDGRTGLLFAPGDPADLRRALSWVIDHPTEIAEMRGAARQEFADKYTAARNYEQLMAIYRSATAAIS